MVETMKITNSPTRLASALTAGYGNPAGMFQTGERKIYMPKTKKKIEIGIIRSGTWLGNDIKVIAQILDETIETYIGDVHEIINIQVKTEDTGLSRFWIFTR